MFEYAEKYGTRKCAIELANMNVKALSWGMFDINELNLDRPKVRKILDSLEEAIKTGDRDHVLKVRDSKVNLKFVSSINWD
jgi:protein-tyrosine phosphatase